MLDENPAHLGVLVSLREVYREGSKGRGVRVSFVLIYMFYFKQSEQKKRAIGAIQMLLMKRK